MKAARTTFESNIRSERDEQAYYSSRKTPGPVCPMCGGPSEQANGDGPLLCHSCADDKERRADERAIYGGPEL